MADTEREIGGVVLEPPVRLAAEATLREAAGVMAETGITCVLVGSGAPRVLTDHDVAGAVAAGLSGEVRALELATREPVWATTSTTLLDAVGLMTGNGIRHLVVLSPDGAVAGVLSLLEATRLLLEDATPARRRRP